MAMIEDQIISNVTCDVGKQTKISSFLKSEETLTKPGGKFHLLFKILPCLLVPYRSVVFFFVFLMLPFYVLPYFVIKFSCLLFSVCNCHCTQYHVVVYMWCEHFFSDGSYVLFPSFSYSFLFFFIPLVRSLLSLFYSLFPNASLWLHFIGYGSQLY